jgi:hypothetical protein
MPSTASTKCNIINLLRLALALDGISNLTKGREQVKHDCPFRTKRRGKEGQPDPRDLSVLRIEENRTDQAVPHSSPNPFQLLWYLVPDHPYDFATCAAGR